MYSYNFLTTIRITYEEFRIKFSSILTEPKIFELKSCKKIDLIENWFCVKIPGVVSDGKMNILGALKRSKINIFQQFSKKNEKTKKKKRVAKLMKNLVLNFQLLTTDAKCAYINRNRYAISYKHKTFNDFSTSKLLANIRVVDRFPTKGKTHKESFIIIFSNNTNNNNIGPTVGKCLLLTFIMYQGYSLFHRKPPTKFEIEALFRLVMLYTDTQKNTHHCKINAFNFVQTIKISLTHCDRH
ncbi:hypothetical protein AGLY_012356 [Aphis glycines]|uniref:Uncharacterized protein n=1 Tax=Aphis glycines TaxID=307491 RepID=A0A6G0TB62_APHGL|nr:hypothetical protein AGLY_012356 [Aphis glycines]